jgi:hypothetical protein
VRCVYVCTLPAPLVRVGHDSYSPEPFSDVGERERFRQRVPDSWSISAERVQGRSTLDMLRSAVVEQLMRRSSDEVAVDAAASASTRQALLAAVGVVLASDAVPLKLGSPVMVLAGFGVLDPAWRAACPPTPESLWSQVEFYRTCGWSSPAACPFVELLASRDAADRHISR